MQNAVYVVQTYDVFINLNISQLLPPGGIEPCGTGIRAVGPVINGVWLIGLIGDLGTGLGGIGVLTIPLLIGRSIFWKDFHFPQFDNSRYNTKQHNN